MAIIPGYDGPLSSYAEWHLAQTGWYYGRHTDRPKLPAFLWNKDHARYVPDLETHNEHYLYTAFTIGRFHRNHPKTAKAIDATVAACIPAGAWKIAETVLTTPHLPRVVDAVISVLA